MEAMAVKKGAGEAVAAHSALLTVVSELKAVMSLNFPPVLGEPRGLREGELFSPF